MIKPAARSMLLLMLPIILAACSNSNGTTNLSSTPESHQATGMTKEEGGLVKVKFDIDANGHVQNARVIESEPYGVYDNEVLQTVKTWRYEKNKPAKDRVINVRLNNNDKKVNLVEQ
ncbi:TonB family protein [Serratia quinivorans]|nr:TonB family protein [Serratia quinivorans]CAI0702169.1 transport protein TonB [Serratia quinivorans]CAI1577419.1 transport protein TonB [Serratia quinivorans]CAI1810849.1 transport protein TonB [Serratia quinivorans]